MRRMSIAAGVLQLVICACEGQGPSVLPNEPIQVVGGQFIAGPLPGTPQADGGANPVGPLAVTQVSVPVLPVGPGAVGLSVSGEVTTDAVSVGAALADLGAGYWVVPVGSTDPLTAQYTFSFSMNVNPTDPPGVHLLRVVAIGAKGNAGQANDSPICLGNPVPDNGHVCNPAKAPPSAVISLSWDTGFDLDLDVMLPDGTNLSPKSPVGKLVDGGTAALAFDRDSWGACVPDGFYQEDLVFQEVPPPGTYEIRVDPFAACGQPAAHFTVNVYVSQPAGQCAVCRDSQLTSACASCQLGLVSTQSGELLASQVTGGAAPGLFVQNQTF